MLCALNRSVAALYGMIHPNASDTLTARQLETWRGCDHRARGQQ
jgi:hypothetical protein